MFSAYIAAPENLRLVMSSVLKEHIEQTVLVGSSSNLLIAVHECSQDSPGVLVIDDSLLEENPALIGPLSQTHYPIVLVAHSDAAATARRALAIHAKDLVPSASWETDLLPALTRVAIPLYPRDKKLGRVISVFSPKGGVGKTTLSVNLAVALAEKAHDAVAIVDLDLSFGDVSVMLGCDPQSTISDLALSRIDAITVQESLTPYSSEVFVLAAPQTPEEAEDIAIRTLAKILETLKENYAYVVVDLAPGYGPVNVTALDISDIILTVCTPDVVTLRTVGQALALFREDFRYPAEKVRLVINRMGTNTGIERSDITTILKSDTLYELPSAGSMPVKAANQGMPLVIMEPSSALTTAIYTMADQLQREEVLPGRNVRRSAKRSLWSRLHQAR